MKTVHLPLDLPELLEVLEQPAILVPPDPREVPETPDPPVVLVPLVQRVLREVLETLDHVG